MRRVRESRPARRSRRGTAPWREAQREGDDVRSSDGSQVLLQRRRARLASPRRHYARAARAEWRRRHVGNAVVPFRMWRITRSRSHEITVRMPVLRRGARPPRGTPPPPVPLVRTSRASRATRCGCWFERGDRSRRYGRRLAFQAAAVPRNRFRFRCGASHLNRLGSPVQTVLTPHICELSRTAGIEQRRRRLFETEQPQASAVWASIGSPVRIIAGARP